MDILRLAINKPVAVTVGIILVVMFGLLGLYRMPYQLSPSVISPEIAVSTAWPGATPYEIERDVIEEQEEAFKGIPGLIRLESESFDGFGRVTLRFAVGADVGDALLRVSNKLDEVPDLPEGTERPVISATGAATSPVIWMILKTLPDNPRHVRTYRTFFENEVRQHLERVEGVADLFVGGGTEDEMHVVVDKKKLAAFGLTVPQLIDLLEAENVTVSAGSLGLGRRDYRIRTTAEFQSPQEIADLVIASDGQRRVRLSDVGRVQFGFEKETSAILHNGDPAIAIGVKPEPGANVLELTDQVHDVVQGLNNGLLAAQGVHLDWAYDQRPYIRGAIDLVTENILVGGALAVAVLLLFLQSGAATLIIALAIPISVIGVFFFLNALGRNLNVVSMAGISFAVGMLVDNAIVVLEAIDRHRDMGKTAMQAAADGAKEVWGAVLASTLTTVAVFLPVVFVQEEAGQLFKDIAIAVTCAISLSLVVSVLVIPMLARFLYKGEAKWLPVLLSPLVRVGGLASGAMMGLVKAATANVATRLVTVLVMTGLAIGSAWAFAPKTDYLPKGNRNLVLTILIPPPGLSLDERLGVGDNLFAALKPHLEGEVGPFPRIRDAFYVSAPEFNILGAMSEDEERARDLLPLFMGLANSQPGIFGISLQAAIFEQRIGSGGAIDVDISGPSIEQLVAAGGAMYGVAGKAIPGAQIRPLPSLEMLYPEVAIEPLRDRLKAAGLTARELGLTMDVLMDGRIVGDFKQEGKKTIDLRLMGEDEDAETPEQLLSSLIAVPGGHLLPVSQVAYAKRTNGITQVRHLERKRTITLQITPPPGFPLQEAMETIDNVVVPQVRQMGLMDGLTVSMSGAADKLTTTRQALQWNFLLAIAITYLLLAALFENFLYPFIILFTVPLAASGGFLGLKLENLLLATQPMDVLTMLGFVILIGVVVNNAILIVHQSLAILRQGQEAGAPVTPRDAVLESTRTRLRPIYMSATTSLFGMLPLVVFPGPGAELYRGLGAVVLGGLAVSTLFTVFVIPSLLLLVLRAPKTEAKA